ncbi:MAG: Fic family protein [Candidatus Algichlamydia australiensis]|nr:Fic family protein [Chlamydiales bacterium]
MLINQVPRFSDKPITIVPNYLYQNPHQGPYAEIEPCLLEDIKFAPASQELIQKIVQETGKTEERVTAEFNWITAVSKLEKILKNKGGRFARDLSFFYFQQLQNALEPKESFSTFSLRSVPIRWAKANCTDINEIVLGCFFESHGPKALKAIYPRMVDLCPVLGQKSILETTPEDSYFLSKKILVDFFNEIKSGKREIKFQNENDREWFEKNKGEIDVKYLERLSPADLSSVPGFSENQDLFERAMNENGWFFCDMGKWYRKRTYVFPPPADLFKLYSETQEYCVNRNHHPILKACRVWFDCVKNHYCIAANKRTGRALAIGILLSNGYLPPRIDEEKEDYPLANYKTFEDPDGFEKFVDYVARKIIEDHTWVVPSYSHEIEVGDLD